MNHVFITTSAFGVEEVLKRGQAFYFPIIAQSGGSGVEVRGELFSEKDSSLKELGRLIEQKNLKSVYSVPLTIWKENGELNEACIRSAVKGAIELGAIIVKFSLGRYIPLKSDVNSLKGLLLELGVEKHNLKVTAENDQTSYGGNVKNLCKFFHDCSFNEVPIKMTFDIGNWNWTREDSYKAALALGKYVIYIHCKHAKLSSNQWITLPLPNDINAKWREVLSALPQDVPKAIEFPIDDNDLEQVTHQYVQLLANA